MGALAAVAGGALLADVVLLAMALELAMLVAAGREPRAVLLALAPGALIALALRAALAGGAWWWVALPLAVSLPLHLADLRGRGWLTRQAMRRSRRRIVTAPTWNKGWRRT